MSSASMQSTVKLKTLVESIPGAEARVVSEYILTVRIVNTYATYYLGYGVVRRLSVVSDYALQDDVVEMLVDVAHQHNDGVHDEPVLRKIAYAF